MDWNWKVSGSLKALRIHFPLNTCLLDHIAHNRWSFIFVEWMNGFSLVTSVSLCLLHYPFVNNWSVSISRMNSTGRKYDWFNKLSLIYYLGLLYNTMHWPDHRGVLLESSVHLGLFTDPLPISSFLVLRFILTQTKTLGMVGTGTKYVHYRSLTPA